MKPVAEAQDAVQQEEETPKQTVKKAVKKKPTQGQRIDRIEDTMSAMFDALQSITQRLEEMKTPEEIEAELDRKAAEQFEQQRKNRTDPELLRKLREPRDPSIIRAIENPDDEEMVRVICRRRVGLNDTDMSDIDEEIDVPKSKAKILQHNGLIEVKL